MKNLAISVILFFFLLVGVSAYTPTNKDMIILTKIYTKIDPICENSVNKCNNLVKWIDSLIIKYKSNGKLVYLLTEVINHLEVKYVNDNTFFEKLINWIINQTDEKESVLVTKITDWDTIHFLKDRKDYITRLIWIDAPENSTTRYWYIEKLWTGAKNYLNSLIWWKTIQIEYDSSQAKTDKYWRHLIYIFYNWENINQKMIEEWFAKEYTYNKPYKYQTEFKEAEKRAKENSKWIWGLENQKEVIKQINIHKETLSNSCNIKWNINSKWEKIYHYPWCRSYTRTKITQNKGERYFCSEKEATSAGWRIAWNCNK